MIIADFANSAHPKSALPNGDGIDILTPTTLRKQARILSESLLAKKVVCARESFGSNIDFLRLCEKSVKPSSSSSIRKIVALVEVRNVEATIETFLTSLSAVVDGAVILDDHSEDLTRNLLLSFDHRAYHQTNSDATTKNVHSFSIDGLLNKSGPWIREELLDRQLLLRAGRDVGGTHFVLLDYDEYFSTDCIANGLLRSSILKLDPGHSLFLPWVELWRSPFIHAVQKSNRHMNFLRRRQVVIFADDGHTQYTKLNSIAKTFSLASSSRIGSIHVLKCPRTLCPPPTNRDDGSDISTRGWGNVTVLAQCRIIEMRFLNLDNVLLKSVWYETLGRMIGTRDGLTVGKMVKAVLKRLDQSSFLNDDSFAVMHTEPEWVSGLQKAVYAHTGLETWRAQDIRDWTKQRGDSAFAGLDAFSLLDVAELRSAVDFAEGNPERKLDKVPLKKKGTLVIAIDTYAAPILSEFIGKLGWNPVDLSQVRLKMKLVNGDFGDEIIKQEWEALTVTAIMHAIRSNRNGLAYLSCDISDKLFTLVLLRVAHSELSSLNILVVFADRANQTRDNAKVRSILFQRASTYALESGSHITLLDVPFASLGSFTSLRWLRRRLEIGRPTYSDNSREDLMFAEDVHHRFMTKTFAPVSRLFFSLNVGRSGSKYIATVLGTATGPVISRHEPACPGRECTKGGGMRMQNQLLSSTYSMRAKVKITMVRNALVELGAPRNKDSWSNKRRCDCAEITSQTNWEYGESWETREIFEIGRFGSCAVHVVRDGVYIETNPNFKSWFYDVVLDEFPARGYDVSVLVLRKYIAAVLESLYETGFFSRRDGYSWMETATSVNAKIPRVAALANDDSLDAIDRFISYIANAEAVFQHVMKQYATKHVRYLEFKSEEVYGVEGTIRLFKRLGIEPSETTRKIAADVHDKYGNGGRKRMGSIALKECAHRFEALVERTGGDHSVVKRLLQNWTRVDGFNYHE